MKLYYFSWWILYSSNTGQPTKARAVLEKARLKKPHSPELWWPLSSSLPSSFLSFFQSFSLSFFLLSSLTFLFPALSLFSLSPTLSLSLFSPLPLENFLLSVICCLLVKWTCHSKFGCSCWETPSVVCYIQWAVQTEYFLLFQIRRVGPLAPKYFLLSFNVTPHPLG